MKTVYILQPASGISEEEIHRIRKAAIKEIESYVKKNCNEDVVIVNSSSSNIPTQVKYPKLYRMVHTLYDISNSDYLFLAGDWKNDCDCLAIKQAAINEGLTIINED